MSNSSNEFLQNHINSSLFTSITFYSSGEIPNQVFEILNAGGAKRSNYFSDYVTHVICGENPEENDITDATDVYEIPAIKITWIYMCAKLNKLISSKPYAYNPKKLFTNLVFCLSQPHKDLHSLWAILTYYGGIVQLNFNSKCTHLITHSITSRKYEKAMQLGADKVIVVTPDWILESIRTNSLVPSDVHHPKRLIRPLKSAPQESTTSITGFEPENVDNFEKTNENVVDSTEALLDKLKKNLPWNSEAEIVPPNVVAPSYKPPIQQQQPIRQFNPNFIQQKPQNQQVVQQQVPRSIVHHTAQPQIVQQQHQQFNLQPQLRAGAPPPSPRQGIPNLRAQLIANPLQQQLLQQRIQQIGQARPQLSLQQQQMLLAQQNRQLITNQQNQQMQQQQQPNQMMQQQSQNQQFIQQQQQQQPKPLFQPNSQIVQNQGNQQQIVQNQPNLAIQQQQQQQQQQFVQQTQQFQPNQPFNQQQPDLNNAQFQQQLLINPQFNQQQQQQQTRAPLLPQQQIWQQQRQPLVRHPIAQQPRVQWSPTQQPQVAPPPPPQRQFIQLDAHTHNELQKMPKDQQAKFVQQLQQQQKQKQLLMQQQQQQQQMNPQHQQAPQRPILIRGSVPPGLSPQQQMAWLQQQAKQQGVILPPNIQQSAPGLSPIQFSDQQIQLRQYRLQQLQLQREQAAKGQAIRLPQPQQQQQQQTAPDSTTQIVDPVVLGPGGSAATQAQQLVVNAKTKTALANMLSIRLQSGGGNSAQGVVVGGGGGGGEVPVEQQSAAGTLRLMTAQHNASLSGTARPQDLMVLQQQQQQRRVISGPNGELIRTPVTPTGVAEKVGVVRQNSVPLQHRPGPFYGHNPNLKLPPDLFLLGCIFVVVEIDRYLDESLPDWQQKIEKHGGEVEKQYCNRVTHVLCETQRHGVVMQALRDCKRCITIYWLSDVMKRKQVLPPWTALHLPTFYLDTTPAAKHLIALSGFVGSERTRVKHMINYTGAKFTSYFSKHNTLLIAAKNDGSKFVHAKKWGIPVVNVQWLTDIMLGNFTALNQMEHIVYQQFPMPSNFSFDPKLVPNLMHAWKMPINISQESYERVKRSASPVLLPKKPKKMKVEEIDENANVNSETRDCNAYYKILFSLSSNTAKLEKIVKQLGGIVANSSHDCTHLVMPCLGRTNKLLHCICRGVKIVPEQWLLDSASSDRFVDEANYTFDMKQFNSDYSCDLGATLSAKSQSRLFENRFFWITPSVYPSRKFLTELIECCGGIVEKTRRTSAQIEATNINSPYSYVIITHENDIHLVGDLLKNKKDKIKIVCNVELIFSAILKQSIQVQPYAVKVL